MTVVEKNERHPFPASGLLLAKKLATELDNEVLELGEYPEMAVQLAISCRFLLEHWQQVVPDFKPQIQHSIWEVTNLQLEANSLLKTNGKRDQFFYLKSLHALRKSFRALTQEMGVYV